MSLWLEVGWRQKLSAILVALFTLGTITVNSLANALPLNGVNTGTLSDEIPNLFVPSGLTFAVWGIIYLLLLFYAVTVIIMVFGDRDRRGWTCFDACIFMVNMLANAAWIFAWHWRLVGLSLGIMAVIFFTLLILGERRWNMSAIFSTRRNSGLDGFTRFADVFLDLPIQVYLGWICVASIANVTAVLVKAGWDGFGLDPQVWTVAVIAAALLVALAFVFLRHRIAAPLVIVWALAGIAGKRLDADPQTTLPVWIAAVAAGALIFIALLVSCLVPRLRKLLRP